MYSRIAGVGLARAPLGSQSRAASLVPSGIGIQMVSMISVMLASFTQGSVESINGLRQCRTTHCLSRIKNTLVLKCLDRISIRESLGLLILTTITFDQLLVDVGYL